MPKYTFICENCGQQTEFSWMLSEYDNSIKSCKCCHCKSKKIHRDYQADDVNCKVKEVKTIGQLAEANTRKNKNKINEESAKEREQKGSEKKPWYHSQGKATNKEINKMSPQQKRAYIMKGETI
jgi:hypothetical protein